MAAAVCGAFPGGCPFHQAMQAASHKLDACARITHQLSLSLWILELEQQPLRLRMLSGACEHAWTSVLCSFPSCRGWTDSSKEDSQHVWLHQAVATSQL